MTEHVDATKAAFDHFRALIKDPRLPPEDRITHADQLKQLSWDDGLERWSDGKFDASSESRSWDAPLLTTADLNMRRLWVVRAEDVVHANEHSFFGSTLADGQIKHTNLTGGAPAFSGGELLFVDESTIVLNGQSGRYGPRSPDELKAVAVAFAQSGYGVWCMGYDIETNRPLPFIGITPQWVS